jgi:hypothetical protein
MSLEGAFLLTLTRWAESSIREIRTSNRNVTGVNLIVRRLAGRIACRLGLNVLRWLGQWRLGLLGLGLGSGLLGFGLGLGLGLGSGWLGFLLGSGFGGRKGFSIIPATAGTLRRGFDLIVLARAGTLRARLIRTVVDDGATCVEAKSFTCAPVPSSETGGRLGPG